MLPDKFFSKDVYEKVQKFSIEAASEETEACGLIVKGEAIIVPNAHPDPVNHFRISGVELAKHKRKDIQAIWHSHWSDFHPGELSLDDLELSHGRDRLPMLLYHANFDEWDYYEPNSPNPFPLLDFPSRVAMGTPHDLAFYLGWRFAWGRSDCYAVIRRYCLGVLNYDIGEWNRPENPQNFPYPDYVCPWTREGLVEVHRDDLRQNDLIEIALNGGKEPNHLAIMVNPAEDQILHHPGYGYLSQLGMYGSYWRSRTVRVMRLESLA